MTARGGVLMYHDVLGHAASGCSGPGAAVYKLSRETFAAHLCALRTAFPQGPAVCCTSSALNADAPFMLTFDDGGCSAIEVATLLEAIGWRGHFFVTSDWIGKPGFLSSAAIRALHQQGHVVGSHSATHPAVLSALTPCELALEWSRSTMRLSDVLGAAVTTGSVPGGYFSREVAATAAQAGIEILWTSEPGVRVRAMEGVKLLGRFAIYHDTLPWEAVALAGARPWSQRRQSLAWLARKPAKVLLGGLYPRVRQQLLAWSSDRHG